MKNGIVIFDGDCGMCNSIVGWLVKKDHSNQLTFISSQSLTGKSLISKHQIEGIDQDTVVFILKDQLYFKSEAVVQISKLFSGPFRAIQYLHFLPIKFRDRVYDLIAKNRYRFFKSATCQIPEKVINN